MESCSIYTSMANFTSHNAFQVCICCIKLKIFFLFFFLGWIISVFVYSTFYLSSQDFPHSSVGEESVCNAGRPWFDPWVGKIRWRRDRLPTLVFLSFPRGSAGKESASNVGDLGSIPGLGRFSGEGKGYPLQHSWGPLMAQLVKNLPAMWETWVQSLGWEDPLEKEKGYPLQYSGLENSLDCIVHGVAKSQTQLLLSLAWCGIWGEVCFSAAEFLSSEIAC